jgi:hypothetical protein
MGTPLLYKLKLNGVDIIMYGEDHTNIDNSYYAGLGISLKKKDLILVEHSTNACEIKPEDVHLFEEHAKGSEWIFYTQKMARNPNVICFDTRSEDGYLNALQEQRLMMLGDKLPTCSPTEIREYIDGVMHVLTAFSDNSERFESVMPGYFDRSLQLLKSQLTVVIHLLRLKKNGDSFPKMLIEVLSGVGYTLAQNLRRVCSVSVDIHLASSLMGLSSDIPKRSNIHVFCGRNHVVRMAMMFNQPLDIFPSEYIMSAEIEVSGDLEEDSKLLQSTKSNTKKLY